MSMQVTVCPCAASRRTRRWPMKPVPPMMKTDISPSPVLSHAVRRPAWCSVVHNWDGRHCNSLRASRAGTTNGDCELGGKAGSFGTRFAWSRSGHRSGPIRRTAAAELAPEDVSHLCEVVSVKGKARPGLVPQKADIGRCRTIYSRMKKKLGLVVEPAHLPFHVINM